MIASAINRLNGNAILRKCSGPSFYRIVKQSNSVQIRNFTQSRILSSDDDLPYHIVVGMPALSPTMETGILSEWYLEEGAEFSAGKE